MSSFKFSIQSSEFRFISTALSIVVNSIFATYISGRNSGKLKKIDWHFTGTTLLMNCQRPRISYAYAIHQVRWGKSRILLSTSSRYRNFQNFYLEKALHLIYDPCVFSTLPLLEPTFTPYLIKQRKYGFYRYTVIIRFLKDISWILKSHIK